MAFLDMLAETELASQYKKSTLIVRVVQGKTHFTPSDE